MKTPTTAPHCFEFWFPQFDTLVLVEEAGEDVVIRATRDTFTEERKIAFVHELAAEGFIPDGCRWCTRLDKQHDPKVHWIVDYSWLELNKEMLARTRRFVIRLLIFGAGLWMLMMAALFLFSGR